MANPFGHIDARGRHGEGLPLYAAFLPALGFTERYHGPNWKVFGTTDALPGAHEGNAIRPGRLARSGDRPGGSTRPMLGLWVGRERR